MIEDDDETNKLYAEMRKKLIMKGATNTFEIDAANTKEYANGFRCFRIVQINKNSSGSFNLGLSCIELYGKPVGGKWLFY